MSVCNKLGVFICYSLRVDWDFFALSHWLLCLCSVKYHRPFFSCPAVFVFTCAGKRLSEWCSVASMFSAPTASDVWAEFEIHMERLQQRWGGRGNKCHFMLFLYKSCFRVQDQTYTYYHLNTSSGGFVISRQAGICFLLSSKLWQEDLFMFLFPVMNKSAQMIYNCLDVHKRFCVMYCTRMIPWETLTLKPGCENYQQGEFISCPCEALSGSCTLSADCSSFRLCRYFRWVVSGSSPGKICSHSTLVMEKCKADQHALWGYGWIGGAASTIHPFPPFLCLFVSWYRFTMVFLSGCSEWHWIDFALSLCVKVSLPWHSCVSV